RATSGASHPATSATSFTSWHDKSTSTRAKERPIKIGLSAQLTAPLLQGHVSFISYGKNGQLATLTHLTWQDAVVYCYNAQDVLVQALRQWGEHSRAVPGRRVLSL